MSLLAPLAAAPRLVRAAGALLAPVPAVRSGRLQSLATLPNVTMLRSMLLLLALSVVKSAAAGGGTSDRCAVDRAAR
jgi:hypothetical protein